MPKRILPFGLLCEKVHSHLVFCAKTSTPIWSTVSKRLLPYGLLCKCAKTSTTIWSTVPKQTSTSIRSVGPKHLLPYVLLCQNIYYHLVYCTKNFHSHLIYCAKTSTPFGLLCKNKNCSRRHFIFFTFIFRRK